MMAVNQKYFDWNKVGEQYTDPIPATDPLTPPEIALCENHGIKFLEKLGSGGYGAVWKVRCSQLLSPQSQRDYTQEDLACKIISISKFKRNLSPPEATAEMLYEYSLHKTLRHPYLIQSEDAFHIVDAMTGFPYVRHLHFMELCNGSVKQLLQQQPQQPGRLGEAEAKVWFRMICLAVQYLHRKNICHMDIKIDNILYQYNAQTSQATFKLSDVGMARSGTIVSGRLGTEAYCAPEQPKRLQAQANPQVLRIQYAPKPCDIWQLGMAVCETLGGLRMHRQTHSAILSIQHPSLVYHLQMPGIRVDTYEFCQLLQDYIVLVQIFWTQLLLGYCQQKLLSNVPSFFNIIESKWQREE
ncbi:hormonally up-regulated neu tumor-associated kinase homolog A-like isoform X2 [Oppia nitens]|nr:hormonally up-regulated neu tumor-associated kinase homolog A-like isoform X2 [Oppia nitens]